MHWAVFCLDPRNTSIAIENSAEQDALHQFLVCHIPNANTEEQKQEIRRQFCAFKQQRHEFQASSSIWLDQDNPKLFWCQVTMIAPE